MNSHTLTTYRFYNTCICCPPLYPFYVWMHLKITWDISIFVTNDFTPLISSAYSVPLYSYFVYLRVKLLILSIRLLVLTHVCPFLLMCIILYEFIGSFYLSSCCSQDVCNKINTRLRILNRLVPTICWLSKLWLQFHLYHGTSNTVDTKVCFANCKIPQQC